MPGRPNESLPWPPNSPKAADAGPARRARRRVRPGTLSANVTLFARRLRRRGLRVGPSEIGDALRALTAVDVSDREQVRLGLRTVFASSLGELPVFDEEFSRFWSEPVVSDAPADAQPDEGEDPEGEGVEGGEERTEMSVADWSEEEAAPDEEHSVPAYSPTELHARKDFSAFSADDLDAISALILLIARRIATRLSRRMRSAKRGTLVDLRRTMRRSLQFGGDPVQLLWRRRKIRKAKLVLLCDVSGSMDIYSRFLVQFIYALQDAVGRVESFLFSTSLTRVTDALDQRDIRRALAEASRQVPDWSGGTKIGASLRTFNETWGRRLLDPRTIVVICSDGWDTGDLEILVDAMRDLRARAGKVIWLNPLLGSPGYEPVTQGMSAALPFVDVFASAHNVDSLRDLERHLRGPRSRRRRGPRPDGAAAGNRVGGATR